MTTNTEATISHEEREAEAWATARTPEGCYETDRPEWWDEEGEGDDIEKEAMYRAEKEAKASAEEREIIRMSAETTRRDTVNAARNAHASNAEMRERTGNAPNTRSARLLAETEYHTEQATRWQGATREARTTDDRDKAAVQAERHGTKAQDALLLLLDSTNETARKE